MKRSQFDISKNKFLKGERIRFLCFAASDIKTNDKTSWSLQMEKCEENNEFQKWDFPYMDKADGERKKKISWMYQNNDLSVHFQLEKEIASFHERRRRARALKGGNGVDGDKEDGAY